MLGPQRKLAERCWLAQASVRGQYKCPWVHVRVRLPGQLSGTAVQRLGVRLRQQDRSRRAADDCAAAGVPANDVVRTQAAPWVCVPSTLQTSSCLLVRYSR